MSHPGAIRNLESTVTALAVAGHHVHLAFERGARDPDADAAVAALTTAHPALTAGLHPRSPWRPPSLAGVAQRGTLDYARYLEPAFDAAPVLRERARAWAPPGVRRALELQPPAVRRRVCAALRTGQRSVPPSAPSRRFVAGQAPDAVVVTPLVEPRSLQPELLRAARRRGVPALMCLLGWDNLTSKGLIHEVPDRVAVWNDEQLEEAVTLHGVPAGRVAVTGAPAYDHWFARAPSTSREAFCARAGLDPRQPYVLYAGSSPFVAPNEAEHLRAWLRAVRERVPEAGVLVRPHPHNPLDGAAGEDPITEARRQDYFDAIHHSAAVVGVNTSAFLDAAAVGRPVLTVLAPETAAGQSGTLHFRHVLDDLLIAAPGYDEHAADLRRALEEPESERSRAFAQRFLRPHGGPATARLVAEIEALA